MKCTHSTACIPASVIKRSPATAVSAAGLRCCGNHLEIQACHSLEPLASNLREAPLLRTLLVALIAFALLTPASASPRSSRTHRRPTVRYFIATAYSVEGTGASGKWSHPGTVAADRTLLPLNSHIRIYGAGRYSGEYTVEDTGGKVHGHHIDVYMSSRAEAKKFGR